METVFMILICFVAGMGAGLGTGFAGLSAATVISPMLITFLGFPAYEAIGIALASDVLASAVSAYTYWKSKITALTGAVSHFAISGKPDFIVIILCVLFTFIWARIGAKWANKADVKKMNRITGIILTILGIVMFVA